MLKFISRFIFWSALIFLLIGLWTITFGQGTNYEFKDYRMANEFYNILLPGIPVAILLTLFGTIKQYHHTGQKVWTVVMTSLFSVFVFFFLLNNIFNIGFANWSTLNILYEHRKNPAHQIREQQYDAGALGYGGKRVVELKPFAGLFWEVTAIDSNKIDTKTWNRVDKKTGIQFP